MELPGLQNLSRKTVSDLDRGVKDREKFLVRNFSQDDGPMVGNDLQCFWNRCAHHKVVN